MYNIALAEEGYKEKASASNLNSKTANAGDTTVKYTADTKLYIDKKLAELTS